MERLRVRGFHPVVEAGPEHVEASKGKATRRYHVRWTDDGSVQFPEVKGTGTGRDDQGARLFERQNDPREFVAIVDEAGRSYVLLWALIPAKVQRLDGMTWVLNVEQLGDHLEAWDG